MCLSDIWKKYGFWKRMTTPSAELSGTGYKIFELNDDGTFSPSVRGFRRTMKLNKWIHERKVSGRTFGVNGYIGAGDFRYKKGFHVLDDKKSVNSYLIYNGIEDNNVLVKVKWKTPTTKGAQNGNAGVIVTKKIKPVEIILNPKQLRAHLEILRGIRYNDSEAAAKEYMFED